MYQGPRKKALIIGINYFGTEHELQGCINDAMNVKHFLVNDRGFYDSQHDMVVMTDHPQNRGTPFYPTGANMMAAFRWLTSYNQPGDILWLSYSGHGGMSALIHVARGEGSPSSHEVKARFGIRTAIETPGRAV